MAKFLKSLSFVRIEKPVRVKLNRTRSIELLKRIIARPYLFSNEKQREIAKNNLRIKMERRDRKVKQQQQLKIF